MILYRSISLILFLKMIFFSPKKLFDEIKNERDSFEIYFVFFLCAVITFLKAFELEKQKLNIFETHGINEFLTLLNTPQIKWLAVYFCYFLFILIVFGLQRLMWGKIKFRPLMLCFMSISGLGFIMQIIFFILQYIFSTNLIFILSYIAYTWVVILSLFVIKYIQNVSTTKAIIIFIVSALPIIFISGFTGISPYLAWLTS